jgi:HEAT repeat protein
MKTRSIVFALIFAAPALVGQRPSVQELIATLGRAEATVHEKARACQQLGEFGTKEAVPSLAALLSDPALAAYARSGLEGIPDPAAAAALRAALGTLKGNQLTGAVNSLGVLRDAKSIPELSRMGADAKSGAAREALLALGRISTRESIAVLRRTLAGGAEPLRSDAASACLLAAEFQLKQNSSQTAVGLYDAVRAANVAGPIRLAATRGAIRARKSEGIALLVKLLRSDDRETRNAALHTVRAMADPKLAPALRSEMATAKPEVQAQLVAALADCCRDAESVRLIRSKAAADHPDVREAVFKALGKIGDPADARLLLQAAVANRTARESDAAAQSLATMGGADVDALVLNALRSATDATTRIALIDLIDARPPWRAATGELLKLAANADVKVSLAALRPLRSVSGPNDVAALIAVTKACRDDAHRTAAESALFYAATRTGASAQAGELLFRELQQASGDAERASWIRSLSSIGYAKALPVIASNMRSGNAALSRTAIEGLGKWPDPAPVRDLLDVAGSTPDAGLRGQALNSVVRLAEAAIEKRQAAPADVLGWLERAGSAARSAEERKTIVAALDRWKAAITNRRAAVSDSTVVDSIDRLRKTILAAGKEPVRRNNQ